MQKDRLKKLYSFALIEILIASGLMAALLLFLLRFYAETITTDKKIEEAREETVARNFLYTSIRHHFLQLMPIQEKIPLPLYTDEKKALHLSYHNDIDLDPAFSGPIRAKLYLEKRQFILQLFALEDEKKTKKIILEENVHKIDFYFFNPQKCRWEKSWDLHNSFIPPLCKIVLEKDHRKTIFTFSIPSKYDIIFYQANS
ncbi:MAG: hypothetical protein JW769_03605 [Parachlamydiales bacterium]|nr:hypothetical protein [Parachlamydiales bacterium]